ncbi:hypothetical protein GDO81_005554 [Engystomops pustulosus]|uniref:Uncharacterized protein n=1 Tax=Engystomops pustulosus TaxID=76066 RepID=A0AAV7CSL5_ENGPU|nr:hypothetical protein GDO81_005554 [Engystomops pustulosus]
MSLKMGHYYRRKPTTTETGKDHNGGIHELVPHLTFTTTVSISLELLICFRYYNSLLLYLKQESSTCSYNVHRVCPIKKLDNGLSEIKVYEKIN